MAKKKVVKATKAAKAKGIKKAVASEKKRGTHPPKAVAKVAQKKLPPKKGFNKSELEHFRGIILEKRKQILEEIELMNETLNDNSGGDYFEENSPYSLHMEQGTDTMEKEKNYLLAARQRKFLEYLDDAIKRIDRRVYGFCQDCGKLIDKARLEAVPHAQLCISCKLKRGQ
ncbi:MAG TPA: TraR/DksA family transcriptional regulator [Candidatus Kryptonia bacterium]